MKKFILPMFLLRSMAGRFENRNFIEGGGAGENEEAEKALIEKFKTHALEIAKTIAKPNEEAIAAMKLQLDGYDLKTLKDIVVKLELEMTALKEESKIPGGVHDSIAKGLNENIEKLKLLKSGDKSEVKNGEFTIKAAGTMLETTNISGGNVPVEQRIPGLDILASRRVRLLEIFAKGKATSNIISWVSQANKDGAAGGTAEGATKNQIDFDLVVASQVVVKRTAFIKVSTEMLEDIDFIETEIRNELMRELLKDIEETAFDGDGNAPNLLGVQTISTAFAAGTFAGQVDNANAVDVLRVAVNQILIANQPAPNYILMHPSDVTALKLVKVSTTDRRYVDALMIIGGLLFMDGIPIIQTTLVPQGEYVIGAFDLATLYERGVIMIQVGLDGNDFTKNLRTILAEWRGALVVRTNKRGAFVTGVFATDAAALESAS